MKLETSLSEVEKLNMNNIQKISARNSGPTLVIDLLGNVIMVSQTIYMLAMQRQPLYADNRPLSRLENVGIASTLLLVTPFVLANTKEVARRVQIGESLMDVKPIDTLNVSMVTTLAAISSVTTAEALRGKTLVKGRRLSKYGKVANLFSVARVVAKLVIHFREASLK